MANKMLIDASHPEETRVVVLRGNRVEEFDFESASKKQLRGNIYLAKVMRVEPSLQAAFVDYGGNRHGFLAFSEIHPDYYQIPVADRQALIEEEARAQRDEDDDVSRSQRRSRRFRHGDRNGQRAEKRRGEDETLSEPYAGQALGEGESPVSPQTEGEQPRSAAFEAEHPGEAEFQSQQDQSGDSPDMFAPEQDEFAAVSQQPELADEALTESPPESSVGHGHDAGGIADHEHSPHVASAADDSANFPPTDRSVPEPGEVPDDQDGDAEDAGEDGAGEIEQLGGDAMEEMPVHQYRHRKQYKIQEVIKRRQVLLVQVVKEERGNKGAALTTYLSLAGRYSVLMPNTARGGGISRKITDSGDRQRLKSIAQELEVPEGMGVIVRTAGAARTKAEVKRDFEYLLRMWETVRETTLQSTAPTLVYEEGSLIKRSIRDLYNKDIDEIVVAGENGYREAKEFMRLLMPSHAKTVQPYRDPQPMFAKSGAEAQLDAMFSNQVTLKSGGYIVINQTEALVAIDVNSGRSTREHNIEDTALRTNLEAADEISRQLRLRDLAGLIVIDFIDMEENRNNRTVERRLKDALKNDRARIQVGRMSHFGLLEMSRQRMRTGVLEGSTVACPHCAGAGMVRSTASIALHVLRVLEDALIKSSSYDIIVKTRTAVALYILNQKRTHLRELEKRFGVSVTIAADDALTATNYYALERGEPAAVAKETFVSPPIEAQPPVVADIFFADAEEEVDAQEGAPDVGPQEELQDSGGERRESENESDIRQRRRRRRRRGRGGDREGSGIAANAPQPPDDALEAMVKIGGLVTPGPVAESDADSEPLPFPGGEDREARHQGGRRRSRRGGRGSREAPRNADGEPLDVPTPEFALAPEPENLTFDADASIGEEGAPPANVRPDRRAPRTRGPRFVPAEEKAPDGQAGAQFAAGDDRHIQDAQEVVSLGHEQKASFEEAESGTHELSKSQMPEADGALATGAPSPHAEEPSQPDDPARPKRSGWWQRARASLRG